MKIYREPGAAVAEPTGTIDLDALLPIPKPIDPPAAPPATPPPATPPVPPVPAPKAGDKIQYPGAYDELTREFDTLTGTPPATPPPVPGIDPNAAPEPPTTPTEEQFKTNKELRAAYDQRKKELAERDAKIKEYEAKMAAQGTPVDVGPLNAKIKELQDNNEELGKRLAFVSYENSPDFEQKYSAPLKAHMQQIAADIGELTVTDRERGEIPATLDHFFALVSAPLKEAARAAQEMFGPAAPLVMNHRNQLVQLQKTKKQAVEEFRANQTAILQKQAADHQIAVQRQHEEWNKVNSEIEAKLPDIFKVDPADKTKSERLQRGLTEWDALHNPKSALTPEQRMRVASAIRYKAAGFGVVFPLYRTAMERIAALEKELAEFQGGTPPAAGGVKPGGSGEGAPSVGADDIETHMKLMSEGVSLDEIMRRSGRK